VTEPFIAFNDRQTAIMTCAFALPLFDPYAAVTGAHFQQCLSAHY